jgi:hypothetical protein
LAQDEMDWRKWYCHKKISARKKKIDQTVSAYIEKCKKSGLDPHSQGVPLGDNCEGYPVLRHIQQGYDQPAT